MTSLHVICGLGLHQSKILATPINWRLPEQLFCWPFFFWENTSGCVLGSWPRAFLSLALRGSVLGKAVLGLGFFCVLGLGLEPCVLDSTSAFFEIAWKNFWRPFFSFLEKAWKKNFGDLFYGERLRLCPWPLEGLFSEGLSLASASSLESSTPHLVMGLLQHRSLTHVRSNPLYTCMIKILLAAFLIAHAHLIQCVLFLSCSAFLCFFFYKTRANTQLLLPLQTGLYRYDEWCKKSTMKTLT